MLDLRSWRERVWGPACERAGVSATPYGGRHSYASALIHEGRALPYVTAALGHSSATTTLNHYAHVFDEARLGTGVQFVDAIRAARTELERSGVWPECVSRPVRTLRRALPKSQAAPEQGFSEERETGLESATLSPTR